MKLFKKVGRRYKSIGEETPRFLADGIWLVQKGRGSCQHICKLSDIKELFPYAQMATDTDELATFLRLAEKRRIHANISVSEDRCVTYSIPCAQDIAKEILLFLSLNKEDRKKEIQKLTQGFQYLDFQGYIRDGMGRVVKHRFDERALLAQKKDLLEKLALVDKKLASSP